MPQRKNDAGHLHAGSCCDKRAAQSKVVGMVRPEVCVFPVYRENETFPRNLLIRFGVPDGI